MLELLGNTVLKHYMMPAFIYVGCYWLLMAELICLLFYLIYLHTSLSSPLKKN